MPRLSTFDNDGLTFDVRDSGPDDGEVVVLLHGYPGSMDSWEAVTPRLVDAGYRVVAPDQRGYSPGARRGGRRNYAIDRLVGDVLALASAAGAERFHVVGHDWGGVVAWALGSGHGARLATLTSLSTPHPAALARSLFSSTQFLRSWYVLFYQLPVLPELSATTAAGRRLLRRTLVGSGLHPTRADRYVDALSSGAAGPAINWYRGLPFAPRSTFHEVTIPTLFLYGAKDFALHRAAAEATERFVTGDYRFEVLEGATHWLPEEHAAELTPALLDFLRRHPVR